MHHSFFFFYSRQNNNRYKIKSIAQNNLILEKQHFHSNSPNFNSKCKIHHYRKKWKKRRQIDKKSENISANFGFNMKLNNPTLK